MNTGSEPWQMIYLPRQVRSVVADAPDLGVSTIYEHALTRLWLEARDRRHAAAVKAARSRRQRRVRRLREP